MIFIGILFVAFIVWSLFLVYTTIIEMIHMRRDQVKFYTELTAASKASFECNKKVYEFLANGVRTAPQDRPF